MLAQSFRDVMNDYNQVQLGYRQKCKERIQRQLEISELILLFSMIIVIKIINKFKKKIFHYLAGRSVTEGEVEEMLESGNPAVFTQGVSSFNNVR